MNVWDYVNSINDKKYLDDLSAYNVFMINKALSHFPDTVLIVNEANSLSLLNSNFKMHYDFLYYMISRKKRFGKWHKKEEDLSKKIELISEYYNCNLSKSRQYLDILSEEDIEEIRKRMQKGG